MSEIPLISLSPVFLLIAYLYSMVGFGGASSYTALLILCSALSYEQVPLLSLACNIVVVCGNLYHLKKWKHFPSSSLTPFLATSIPLAFLGGMIPVSKLFYQSLLGFMLLIAAIKLLFIKDMNPSKSRNLLAKKGSKLLVGGTIGLASGIAGIGGGILLSPLLHFTNWGRPKTIAAASSLFILVNSTTGLAGQLVKAHTLDIQLPAGSIFIILAVFLGGQLGIKKTCANSTQRRVKTFTGLLILFAAFRLQLPLVIFIAQNLRQ